MNSGGVVIATTAVDGAAAAVTVATVASAAVLVVRTVNAVAQFAARTVHVAHSANPSREKSGLLLADSTAGSAAQGTEAAEANEAETRWDAVAAQVVVVNARIMMLGAQTDRPADASSGAASEPVHLQGLTVADAARQALRAAEQLADDQAAARAAVAAEERREVAALLPQSIASRSGVEVRLARFQHVLFQRDRTTRPGPDRPPAVDDASGEPLSGIDAGIEELLLALDQDANAWEHREVLGAAVRVVADDPDEARAQLGVLRGKVAAVNEAVGRRRLAACWLSALEEPAVGAVELPGQLRGVARRLRGIVAGEEELTPEAAAQAAEAVAWAAGVARLRFVRDAINECLVEQGYLVDGEPDPENRDELRLTRTEWQGQHSVEIWLDRHGAVHGRLVRESHAPADHGRTGQEVGNGNEPGMIEQLRIARFNADLELLGRRLHSAVLPEAGYVPRDEAAGARRPAAAPAESLLEP